MSKSATTIVLNAAPKGLTSKGGHPVKFYGTLPEGVRGCYIVDGVLYLIDYADKKKASFDLKDYLAWKANEQMKTK